MELMGTCEQLDSAEQEHLSLVNRRHKVKLPRGPVAQRHHSQPELIPAALHLPYGQFRSSPLAEAEFPGRNESPSATSRFQRNPKEKKPRPAAPLIAKFKQQQQQRDRRRLREKRRSAGPNGQVSYLASTEGTSTGEEDVDEGFAHLHRQDTPDTESFDAISSSAPPKLNLNLQLQPHNFAPNLKSNKSPSDLDADDEDNQDYDSASIISQSEFNISGCHAAVVVSQQQQQQSGSDFDAQFHQIRLEGVEKLNQPASNTDTSSNEELKKMSQGRPEDEKDRKILELEKTVKELTNKLRQYELSKGPLQ